MSNVSPSIFPTLQRITKYALKQMDSYADGRVSDYGLTRVSQGGFGEDYEDFLGIACHSLNVSYRRFAKRDVIDFTFPKFKTMVQVKTNQGGEGKNIYQFGKVKSVNRLRIDAVLEAKDRILKTFEENPDMNDLYLYSLNYPEKTVEIYNIAGRKDGNVLFGNDFIMKSPRGFNPSALIGPELQFRLSVMEKIHSFKC